MIKISVIVPSLNQGKFIGKNISSVLSQNYKNLEYIILDGGSYDNTVKILKSFGKKIIWTSKKDKGAVNAVNEGIKKASGEVVLVMGADDYLLPNSLQTISEIFARHKNLIWLFGDYEIVNEKGKKILPFIASYKKILRLLPPKIIIPIVNVVPTPSTATRT